MKNIYLIFFTTIALFSCKKSSDDKVTPETDTTLKTFTNKIVLNEPQITGDSLKISWSLLDTVNFRSYTLLRKDFIGESMTQIHQFYDKNKTSTIDNAVPYSPSVEYQVRGELFSGKSITSNIITYARPEIELLSISPFDIIYNNTDKLLYFFEKNGKISIYSISKKTITKSINTEAEIGYSDFGIYKGKKELYVPRNDGWIFVYNAVTLEKTTQISTGLSNSCVVFNNNNLYISTSAWTNRPIKVLSRETGHLITETGNFDLTRFKHIPNTNFNLLEITLNVGPVDQHFYSFTPAGKLINRIGDRYHGDYPLDSKIFEIFPDGSKYITSSSGAIYNINMTYQLSLPRGNLSFTTFALNQTEKLIYAGCDTKKIKVYSMDGYNDVKTIITKAYPYKLFDVGNQLLSISSSNPICIHCTSNVKYIVIEYINK